MAMPKDKVKKIDIDELVRPNVLNFEPYRSARDDFSEGILLDANENALGSPFESELELNRYPDPYQYELRKRFAEFRNINIEQVCAGVGSDEVIDLLVRIFCQPGRDRILSTPPTYGWYKVTAQFNNVYADEVMLTPDFQLDTEKILEAVTGQTRMIFLCSPNNPTGNKLKSEDIETILDGFDGLVVVDEAYIDFAEEQSMAAKLDAYENLIVLQTLSKSFGLAGIRLGVALASPAVIKWLMRVKPPYNVNKLTLHYAEKAFEPENLESAHKNIATLIEQRKRLASELEQLSGVEKVFPSDANFLLVKVSNAYSVYQELAQSGVIVRYRGHEPMCEDTLRISVGTPEQNSIFLEKFKTILGGS